MTTMLKTVEISLKRPGPDIAVWWEARRETDSYIVLIIMKVLISIIRAYR